MKTRQSRLGLMLLVPLALLAAGASYAGKSGTLPVVHGKVIRDFARITFEWPDPAYFTATAEGRTLSISFDRKATPDFSSLLKTLHPYIKKARRKPDGRTVVLTLDKPYRIRTFVSDNINGVDLLEINPKRRKLTKKTEPRFKRQMDARSAALKAARLLAALSPAAGDLDVKAEKEPEDKKENKTKHIPTVEKQAPPPSSPPAVELSEKAKELPEEPIAQNITKPVVLGESPIPLSYSKKDNVKKSEYLKVSLSASDDSAVLRFPLHERVALATFVRGHSLWVVISKPYKVDVSDFSADTKTVISNPEIIPSAKATILRFTVDESMHISTTKESSSYNWAVLMTAQQRPLQKNLIPAMRTDPPTPPHIFVPALEMADPIAIRDPRVGDQLVVIPLFKAGVGMASIKDFIEFTLLETAQGVAVLKKADGVKVALARNGLRVTASAGETLTPGLPMAEIKGTKGSSLHATTLFPYHRWKTQNPKDIKREIDSLFRNVVKHRDDKKKANESRLAMVKIYMGQGMAVEALGILDVIREVDPAFYRANKLAAIRGVGNFLIYRYADASRDLAVGELDNNKEMSFWRKVIADLLGNLEQDYDFLALDEDYISKYPPEIRRRVLIVAADRSIAENEYNEALKIIESMGDPELVEPVKNYINFLMGSISAGTGQETKALEIWDELAENYTAPFIRASAELSRITWGIVHEELTTNEAVERLERLRLSWHGDRLELQVIRELGDIYERKKDYVNAMRIWHGGITSFPNSSLAVEMKEKMQQAFKIMFSQGGVDKLPPLDVLAMYYEYRNYAPLGGAGGEIIEKLSERLMAIDLLKQASDLLDSQMRFVAEKEKRSQLGAKLAHIYLLDKKPERALSALQDSLYGENSLLLRLLRNRLAAHAMVDQDRLQSALGVLGQDTSIDAERIRLNVYWKQRNWEEVISSVEDILKEREDITAQVTLDESEALMKLALAYVFENNDIQLQYLRDYFLPLMENNPYREVFDYVTHGEMVITTTNFDEIIKNLSDTRSFIKQYRTRIKMANIQAKEKSQ